MGRADLIGPGKRKLVPAFQPKGTGFKPEGARRPEKYKSFRTQHTGLPPAQVANGRKSTAKPKRAIKAR